MQIDWTSLIGPAVVAAVIAAAVSIIVAVINRATLRAMHRERLNLDRDLADRRANADIALARRYRFIAIFGPEAAKPYDDFWRVRGEIIVAVQMLLQTHRQRELGSLPQDRKTWETTMGWVHTAQDPIEVRLNQIIEDIEKTCRPAIQEVVQ